MEQWVGEASHAVLDHDRGMTPPGDADRHVCRLSSGVRCHEERHRNGIATLVGEDEPRSRNRCCAEQPRGPPPDIKGRLRVTPDVSQPLPGAQLSCEGETLQKPTEGSTPP